MALWDICGKAAGLPVAVLLGGVIRDSGSKWRPAWGFSRTSGPKEMAAWYVEQGFSTLKTKAGANMQEDLDMVRGVRDAVGNKLKLRIDPNRAYSPHAGARTGPAAGKIQAGVLRAADRRRAADRCGLAAAANEHADRAQRERDRAGQRPGKILRADAAAFILPDTPQAGGKSGLA